MLRRAGRADLIAAGFAVDDDALARSNALTRDRDHAIYHALFDKGAPHAAVISPLPPPETDTGHEELLKWVVSKQTEAAALDRAAAATLAGELGARVEAALDAATTRDIAATEGATRTIVTMLAGATAEAAERVATVTADADAALVRAVQVLTDRTKDQADELLVETRGARLEANEKAAFLGRIARQEADKTEARHELLLASLHALTASVDELSHERLQADAAVAERAEADRTTARERWEAEAAARVNFANLAEKREAERERRRGRAQWIRFAVLVAILLAFFATHARAQPSAPIIVGAKASGTVVTGSQRQSGPYYIDCGASTTFSAATSTLTCPGSGGASLPSTTNVIKGNGSGAALAATPGTDYVIPGGNVATATALATTPTPCTAPQVPTGVLANGNATGCAVPGVVAVVNLTGQTGAVAKTTLYAPTTGMYMLSTYVEVTSPGGAGCLIGDIYTFADSVGAQSFSSSNGPDLPCTTKVSGNPAGLYAFGIPNFALPLLFYFIAGTNVTYQVTTAGTTTGLAFNYRLVLTRLN
jgi:hypothetical protein